MSGIPLLVNEQRNKVVDPGFPVMGDPVVLGYVRPVLRPDLAGFVKPFNSQVLDQSTNRYTTLDSIDITLCGECDMYI